MTSGRTSKRLAYEIRREALGMVHRANASHIGGALSCADILAVLYHDVLNVRPAEPDWTDRDRFIFSKGHCCTALYAALALQGFWSVKELETYGRSGTMLMSHASHKVPGVEWSTGSLGHGLGLGCGQALAARRQKAPWKVYVLISDGEMNEGSVWESLAFAAHHQLHNLVLIIDRNGQQGLGPTEHILDLSSLPDKLRAFRWMVHEVNGHAHSELKHALSSLSDSAPTCVIADTVKGKGVRFMEDNVAWHYQAPKTEEQLKQALIELDAYYPQDATR